MVLPKASTKIIRTIGSVKLSLDYERMYDTFCVHIDC